MNIPLCLFSKKFPRERNIVADLLPHRRHLQNLFHYFPGKQAYGMATFCQDFNHFPKCTILLSSEIQQALLEIAEIAIRSHSQLKKYYFLAYKTAWEVRQPIPITQKTLMLRVSAEKISKGAPTHGKIKASLFFNEKSVSEIIISYMLVLSISIPAQ